MKHFILLGSISITLDYPDREERCNQEHRRFSKVFETTDDKDAREKVKGIIELEKGLTELSYKKQKIKKMVVTATLRLLGDVIETFCE